MSKQEFIQNVRLARNLFAHRVSADHAGADVKGIERRLSRATLWLTPRAVSGFDPADFPELSAKEGEELDRSVRAFRMVGEQVAADVAATREQEAAALQSFESIRRILEPYFATPDELRLLREAMKKVDFPDSVETWDYEFGRDSSAEPAVWIWLIVDDAAAEDTTLADVTIRLRREIHRAVQSVGLERWPYVRVRTVSEQGSIGVGAR